MCVFMKKINNSYDSVSREFSKFVGNDPSRLYVQYPWAIDQISGPFEGLNILDIGCGEGSLARMFARKGAHVYGYDNSAKLLKEARVIEKSEPLGIEYVLADQHTITKKMPSDSIDHALSTCVLHYAENFDHLTAFFSSTFVLLRPGKKFSALVCNPDFKRFDQVLYGRRYHREPNGKLRVDFINDDGVNCSATYSDFKRKDYERAAALTGWDRFSWLPVKVTREGTEKMGSFWNNYEEDCPYVGFQAIKPL